MDVADIIADQPSMQTRREWAVANSATLAALLETEVKSEVPQRLWRLRYIQDGDYLVATLAQNLNVQAPPGAQVPKVTVYVVRPYDKTIIGGSVVTQNLFGDYSTDEIVAFLRLDLVDPDSVQWHDETHYSRLIRAGTIASLMKRND